MLPVPGANGPESTLLAKNIVLGWTQSYHFEDPAASPFASGARMRSASSITDQPPVVAGLHAALGSRRAALDVRPRRRYRPA